MQYCLSSEQLVVDGEHHPSIFEPLPGLRKAVTIGGCHSRHAPGQFVRVYTEFLGAGKLGQHQATNQSSLSLRSQLVANLLFGSVNHLQVPFKVKTCPLDAHPPIVQGNVNLALYGRLWVVNA